MLLLKQNMITEFSTSGKIIIDLIFVVDVDEYGAGEEQQLFHDVDNNDSISSVSFQDSPMILPTQSVDTASKRIDEPVAPSIPPPPDPQSSLSGDWRLVLLPASPLESSSS